jgi:hypothetical protein
MNEQDRINAFSLAAHRVAVAALRAAPERVVEARAVLQRWRDLAGGPGHSDRYWSEWDALLSLGIDAVEQAVCIAGDHAATLRSVSPLGRFVLPADRYRLLRQTREMHEA